MLCIDVIQNISKENISMVKKNKLDQKSCIFYKLLFSLLIFSDRNNIAKLVGDISGNCFNICQLLYNWIRMNIISERGCSQMFDKVSDLRNFGKFTWKHIRPVTQAT